MPAPSPGGTRIARTYTFDKEVVDLLNQLVGEPKGHGAFLSRRVHVEAARREERAKRQQAQLTEMVRVID